MTPEEKEEFRLKIHNQMEKAYSKDGYVGVIGEIKNLCKKIDEGKL